MGPSVGAEGCSPWVPAPRGRLDLFAACQSACASFAFTQIPLKELLQTEFVMHIWEFVFFSPAFISHNEIPGHFLAGPFVT